MTRRSKVKRITRQRWKQPCWKTPPPTSTGAEMLPALLLCFCRIIKQGSSFLPALPGSHLGRRGAEEPVPTAWHKPKPGEAAALKTLLDFWSMLGFWSAHLVKLIVHKLGISNFWMLSILWCCESFLTKSQRIRETNTSSLYLCAQSLPMACSSRELGKDCSRNGFPELLGDLQCSPEFSHSDLIQI